MRFIAVILCLCLMVVFGAAAVAQPQQLPDGKADFLYKSAVALHETLEKGGIKHTWIESAGGHIWPNWRRYLRDFAPLPF
jgi:S-formylglutathione hydrolase FrmB